MSTTTETSDGDSEPDRATTRDADAAPRPAARLRPYLPLVAIGVVAFGVRLATMHLVRPVCASEKEAFETGACWAYSADTLYVGSQATALAEGRWFVDAGKLMYGIPTDAPGASHPPLYTVFLAILQKLGLHEVGQWRIAVALVGSMGVTLLGVAAWRAVAGRAATTGPTSRSVGIIAASIAAIDPLLLTRDVDMFVEALLIPMIALVLILALRFWRSPGAGTAALLGAMVGVCWLTRGEQILLLAFMLPLFLLAPREVSFGRRLGLYAISAGVACLVVAPWVVYNNTRFAARVTMSTDVGGGFLLWGCDEVFAGPDFGYYNWDCLYRVPVDPDSDDSVKEQVRARAGLDYIANHRRRALVVVLAKEGRFWDVYDVLDTNRRAATIEGHGWLFSRTGLVAYYALLPLAVAGAVSLRRRRVPISPFVAPALVAATIVMLFIPLPRFRLPADAAAIPLAAIGAHAGVRAVRARRNGAG